MYTAPRCKDRGVGFELLYLSGVGFVSLLLSLPTSLLAGRLHIVISPRVQGQERAVSCWCTPLAAASTSSTASAAAGGREG